MKVAAEFQNEVCRLVLTPADEWEQKLLGAVAKGSDTLSAVVTYKPDGHLSYGKCQAVQIYLDAGDTLGRCGGVLDNNIDKQMQGKDRPIVGMSHIDQFRAFVEFEQNAMPEKTHIAAWALQEIERLSSALREARQVMLVEDSLSPNYGWKEWVDENLTPLLSPYNQRGN